MIWLTKNGEVLYFCSFFVHEFLFGLGKGWGGGILYFVGTCQVIRLAAAMKCKAVVITPPKHKLTFNV